MELSTATARAVCQLCPPISTHQLPWRPSSLPISVVKQGCQSYKYLSVRRLGTSDESTNITRVKDETDSGIIFEDRPLSKEKEYDQKMMNGIREDEPASVTSIGDGPRSEEEYENTVKNEAPESEVKYNDGYVQDEAPEEDSAVDVQRKLKECLDQINVKLDSAEDSYSILLFGGTAAVTLWLATAIVGAVDSIPLLPKLLEVVGLGFTVWFSYRYLIFKRNRDELGAKIEEVKHQVIGSKDE